MNSGETQALGTIVRYEQGDTSYSAYVMDVSRDHVTGDQLYLVASVTRAYDEQHMFCYSVLPAHLTRECRGNEISEFENAVSELGDIVHLVQVTKESSRENIVRVGDWVGVCVDEGEPGEKEVWLVRKVGDHNMVFAQRAFPENDLSPCDLSRTKLLKDHLAYTSEGLALCRTAFRGERQTDDVRGGIER